VFASILYLGQDFFSKLVFINNSEVTMLSFSYTLDALVKTKQGLMLLNVMGSLHVGCSVN